jgi:orotate phosphoribosyltransferase
MLAAVGRLAQPRRGHFELGTGYHGDLWLDLDALFLRPARLRPYVQWLSARLDAHQIDAVCGPLEGGAFLAQAVAEVLDTAFVPAGRAPGSPGPGQAGYRLPPAVRPRVAGWRVAIVDDAISAGTAVAACFRLIRESGAVPAAAGALLALGRGAATVEATMSVPCYAAATLPCQVWPAADCPPVCHRHPAHRPGRRLAGQVAGLHPGLVRLAWWFFHAEAEDPGGMDPDQGAAVRAVVEGLRGAPDLQEPDPPRIGGGDVIHHERGLAVAADVMELLAGRQVEAGHVDRAEPRVDVEPDGLDLRAAVRLDGGQPAERLAAEVDLFGVGEGHLLLPFGMTGCSASRPVGAGGWLGERAAQLTR